MAAFASSRLFGSQSLDIRSQSMTLRSPSPIPFAWWVLGHPGHHRKTRGVQVKHTRSSEGLHEPCAGILLTHRKPFLMDSGVRSSRQTQLFPSIHELTKGSVPSTDRSVFDVEHRSSPRHASTIHSDLARSRRSRPVSRGRPRRGALATIGLRIHL